MIIDIEEERGDQFPHFVMPPTIYTTNTAGTSHSFQYAPGGNISAGERMFMFVVTAGDIGITVSGWTQIALTSIGTSTGRRLGIYYRLAVGNEIGTQPITLSRSEVLVAANIRLPINSRYSLSVAANGTSAAPKAPAHTANDLGKSDTLWLTVISGRGSTLTGNPAGYIETLYGLSGSNVNMKISTAKLTNTITQNPSAVSLPASDVWVAYTMAFKVNWI